MFLRAPYVRGAPPRGARKKGPVLPPASPAPPVPSRLQTCSACRVLLFAACQLSSRLLQIGPYQRRRPCVQCVSHEHRRVRDARRKDLFCLKQQLRHRCHPDSQRLLPGLCCFEQLGDPNLLRRGRQAAHTPSLSSKLLQIGDRKSVV